MYTKTVAEDYNTAENYFKFLNPLSDKGKLKRQWSGRKTG